MKITTSIKHTNKKNILALGAESAGNFSVFKNGEIYFSEDFGDLLEETNWENYQISVLTYLKTNQIKPEIILTDLHPLYKTTTWGKELAKKYHAKLLPIQHHHAHIFSVIGDKMLYSKSYKSKTTNYGIAMDGTGYGTDEKIWGGEVFKVKGKEILRIGHLENQIILGGDLAVKEPARMLIGVLSKILSNKEIYPFIRKYYTRNQFELLYNQLSQNFNCQETSSTGRILDAVSLLLGFCNNERKHKHEPINLLEKNSTVPYSDLIPKIIFDEKEKIYILQTTPLFKYLIKNINKDKKKLAATAQLYIAKGLYEIIKLKTKSQKPETFFISGGISNNKIISSFLESKGAYVNKKIQRGDAGLSFGQVVKYLLN
ncbi:MAG: hypothetical protein WAV31_05595 [Candidatus Moraniibacteriota bacterium]